MQLLLFPLLKPVRVRAYLRFRLTRWERVRSHNRSLPRNSGKQAPFGRHPRRDVNIP